MKHNTADPFKTSGVTPRRHRQRRAAPLTGKRRSRGQANCPFPPESYINTEGYDCVCRLADALDGGDAPKLRQTTSAARAACIAAFQSWASSQIQRLQQGDYEAGARIGAVAQALQAIDRGGGPYTQTPCFEARDRGDVLRAEAELTVRLGHAMFGWGWSAGGAATLEALTDAYRADLEALVTANPLKPIHVRDVSALALYVRS